MRLVVQRVSSASVKVVETDKIVGSIKSGLFVLVGIKKGDCLEDARVLAEKLVKLRIMADESTKINLIAHEFLVVSQFTLYADTKGGNRPSFVGAAPSDEARKIYEHFVKTLREKNPKVETGSFGDYMEISTCLDGPVTIILEN
jgi:D-tyrosyl-tRNA(Tyr) deacylase